MMDKKKGNEALVRIGSQMVTNKRGRNPVVFQKRLFPSPFKSPCRHSRSSFQNLACYLVKKCRSKDVVLIKHIMKFTN